MAVPTQLKNQHLLWRAGFGPKAEEIPLLYSSSPHQLFKSINKISSLPPGPIEVASNSLKGVAEQGGLKELGVEDKRQIRIQNREELKTLNLSWLSQMVSSDKQLVEKMSLFWHGHFACRSMNVFYQQLLLDVIRKNALGNFGDLLKEVSKSAAMLNFLNNNQNRKGHPNENFAREVMELFTMGRGNYSEEDIKESARAFTGWGANVQGEFVFRRLVHDDSDKTFLKRTGNYTGDDVLNILLEQKATAAYISRKVYRYFVNDNVDEAKAEWLAHRFYKSNYDIRGLMEDIFTSDWFYEPKNIGAKIKSPVELLVGIRRIVPMKFENEEVQLLVQRVLGQLLFYPPNVAGWPGGKNWIDSSSLMFRLRLPQLIEDKDEFAIKPKEDDDQTMGMMDKANPESGTAKERRKANGQQIKAEINWPAYYGNFAAVPREKLGTDLARLLLQTPGSVSDRILNKYADAGSRESFIKTTTIQLMSSPEYQLC